MSTNRNICEDCGWKIVRATKWTSLAEARKDHYRVWHNLGEEGEA